MYTFRQYASDDSFTNLTAIPSWVKKFQVTLAFAIDYNGDKSSQDGNFMPYWDTNKVTPSVIAQFKQAQKSFQIEVLVSIGDRNNKYPFAIGASQKQSWVNNATNSLKKIIKDYNMDGIDVYYEDIKSEGEVFVDSIGQLITNLKNEKVISVASIAPTSPLNTNFYFPLHQKYGNFIDTVVYQCFTETNRIGSIGDLMNLFDTLRGSYPRQKLLAGYSTISKDWATVSPPLYFFAVTQLLFMRKLEGTAIWVISDSSTREVTTTTSDSVTSFPKDWILELMSFTFNQPSKEASSTLHIE
ncbi:Glycoside hydrolase family 18, catalytic domain [Sesbania bispinosa]|nr:Glycoside hydrolase family 18, catalytic domain [Sesbania bispinosa]